MFIDQEFPQKTISTLVSKPRSVFLGLITLIPAMGNVCLRNRCSPLPLQETKGLSSVWCLVSIFRKEFYTELIRCLVTVINPSFQQVSAGNLICRNRPKRPHWGTQGTQPVLAGELCLEMAWKGAEGAVPPQLATDSNCLYLCVLL